MAFIKLKKKEKEERSLENIFMSWTHLDQMKEIKCKIGIARAEQSNTRPDLGPCSFLQPSVIEKTLGNTGHIKDIQSCIANSRSLEVSSGMTIAQEILETLYYTLQPLVLVRNMKEV